jgi:type IV pilus assembly protein PilC
MSTKKIDKQILFIHEFLTFVKSGVSLVESLDFLKSQSSLPPATRQSIHRLHAKVKQGNTLADSLREEVGFLEDWQLDLIEASEKSGTLTEGLLFIKNLLEKKKEHAKRIFFACLHPAFYTVVFMIAYPLRELMGMLIHRDMAYVAAYLMAEAKLFIILASVIFFVKFLPVVFRTGGLKRVYDSVILRIPLFGTIIKRMFMYQFFYVFGTCYARGCPLVESWRLAARMSENQALAARLQKGEAVLKGQGELDTAFYVTGLFPEKIINLIKAGIKSGTMKDQTEQCMRIYREQYEMSIQKMEMVLPKLFYFVIVFLLIGILIKLVNGYFNAVFNLVPFDQAI